MALNAAELAQQAIEIINALKALAEKQVKSLQMCRLNWTLMPARSIN